MLKSICIVLLQMSIKSDCRVQPLIVLYNSLPILISQHFLTSQFHQLFLKSLIFSYSSILKLFCIPIHLLHSPSVLNPRFEHPIYLLPMYNSLMVNILHHSCNLTASLSHSGLLFCITILQLSPVFLV